MLKTPPSMRNTSSPEWHETCSLRPKKKGVKFPNKFNRTHIATMAFSGWKLHIRRFTLPETNGKRPWKKISSSNHWFLPGKTTLSSGRNYTHWHFHHFHLSNRAPLPTTHKFVQDSQCCTSPMLELQNRWHPPNITAIFFFVQNGTQQPSAHVTCGFFQETHHQQQKAKKAELPIKTMVSWWWSNQSLLGCACCISSAMSAFLITAYATRVGSLGAV